MKMKVKGHHIPTKEEDPGIVAAALKTGEKFNKPRATIEKYVSKSDKVE
jgi:hypothetical protein